ncbi:MAG: SusC/RagA family TonB-linked outer membrane protein [Williamsia sp.]|nr:SusC/RagA family TonB-linked outer membrane protein [Williamsia sp.]
MRKCFTLLLVLMSCAFAQAQNRTITGVVRDEKGAPVPFASITITGRKTGTTADADGNFKITIPANTRLSVSASGYKETPLIPSNAAIHTVVLQAGTGQMEEVVVTALGIKRQARSLGYSAATVKADELTQARTTNVQNGLVGKVSGLQISTVNNGVFADTRIVLRGIRSLTGNNQPLLVIDGAPVALSYINTINPNDVDNISVLKGANASAIYGPDGVNGVILVTTKKGTTRRPEVSVGNTTFFEKISFMPDLQTRFGSGSAYDQFGDGTYDPIENQSWGLAFNGDSVNIGRADENGKYQRVKYSYIPDEKKRFFETGITIQNDVSVRSGDERGDIFLSVQDVKTKSIMPKDEARRTSFRINSNRKFGKFNLQTNLNYIQQTSNTTTGGIYNLVINTPGDIPLTSYKDYKNYQWADHNHFYNDYYANPYEEIDRLRAKSRYDRFVGNISLNVKPFAWLDITNRVGLTVSAETGKSTTGAIFYSPLAKAYPIYQARNDKLASVSDYNNLGTRITNDLIASADKTFGDFNLKVVAGTSFRQSYSKNVSVSGSNLAIPTLFNVSAYTGIPGADESYSLSRIISGFGSVGIGYKNWANLEFTSRNDWDSRLNKTLWSIFYPGVNAAVVLSDAIPSIKNNEFLNYLKVKAAWNITGNVTINPYSLESTLSPTGSYPYGSIASYAVSNTINNPFIKPEKVESYETGLEANFLHNRISLEATYYYQNNDDQVINVNISQATGFTVAPLNAARFLNKGLEFDLRLTPLFQIGQFKWNISGNLSINDSKVLEVYKDLKEVSNGNNTYAIKGYPAYVFKLTDWFRDSLGRVIVDPISGFPKQNTTPTIFGRNNPKYIAGFTTDFSYKGLSLRMVAEYRSGNYIYNAVGSSYAFTGIDRLSGTNGRQRFVIPNSVYLQDGKYVENKDIVVINNQYDFLQATSFRNTNTNYYTSAAFWKLREVVLAYDLPKNMMAKTKFIKKATVSLIGRNLLMLRPSTNWWTDPEFSSTTGNAIGSTTISQTPPTRLMGFNVNLTF